MREVVKRIVTKDDANLPCQLDESIRVHEGDWSRVVVARAALDHAAHVLVVEESVVVRDARLESGDDVRVVEVHVLDAAGEVLVDDEPLFHVRHASDVEIPVEVELVKITPDSVPRSDSVHGQNDIPAFPAIKHHHHELIFDLLPGILSKERNFVNRNLQRPLTLK